MPAMLISGFDHTTKYRLERFLNSLTESDQVQHITEPTTQWLQFPLVYEAKIGETWALSVLICNFFVSEGRRLRHEASSETFPFLSNVSLNSFFFLFCW